METKSYPPGSLAEKLIAQTVPDWRFPDEYGLSERSLDCRQLAISEILKWQGETEILPLFLNPFDCKHDKLLLRRSEPKLQRGWRVIRYSPPSSSDIRPLIRSIIDEKGYALIYYNAFYMPFHSYYGVHDVEHWSLAVHCGDDHVTLIDDSGSAAYFSGYIGSIPWDIFTGSWEKGGKAGAATILRKADDQLDWNDEFIGIVEKSLAEMIDQGGLENLAGFIRQIEQTSLCQLVRELERLEFDIHYFRRLRELWKTAVEQRAIPEAYLQQEWVEELQELCKCWSLIMGVLMKWKRQPERDYHAKLVDYLWQAHAQEKRFFAALGKLTGGREWNSGS